jgi:hypothetical protein
MKQILRNNGLSITLFGLFVLFEVGLTIVGQQQYNQEQVDHGQPRVSYLDYLTSPALLEATMENWESEFLQMFAYVLLTAYLIQRGAADSRKPEGDHAVDRDPRLAKGRPNAPWPVRKGGLILQLYKYSLSIALFLLFALSLGLHALGGAREYSLQELAHGGYAVSVAEYLGSAQFWFESLQNWQSEFLAVGVMVALSIVLRHQGSPESKPVDAPHSMTGSE